MHLALLFAPGRRRVRWRRGGRTVLLPSALPCKCSAVPRVGGSAHSPRCRLPQQCRSHRPEPTNDCIWRQQPCPVTADAALQDVARCRVESRDHAVCALYPQHWAPSCCLLSGSGASGPQILTMAMVCDCNGCYEALLSGFAGCPEQRNDVPKIGNTGGEVNAEFVHCTGEDGSLTATLVWPLGCNVNVCWAWYLQVDLSAELTVVTSTSGV
ncbi:hypothetical protein CB1_000526049 [Camelus ferus]|nr:hypothetical protein CB1_000526049 [Camelus ferus]